MTSDLTFTLFRLGYLVFLWLLVLGAVSTLRRDIFGTVVTPRGKGRKDADRKRRESRRAKTDGPLVGTIIPLGASPIIIGRSPSSTLVLEDEYASSQHARLTPADGQWWIEDLGSRNGTFVDDERLTSPRELNVGDIVRIGQTTLELVK